MANQEPRDERDLLEEIGVSRNVEAPSAFDLLGVPENCEDDQLIRKRAREQAKPLKKWEQYRANPAVQKMATALKLAHFQRPKKTPNGKKPRGLSEGTRTTAHHGVS